MYYLFIPYCFVATCDIIGPDRTSCGYSGITQQQCEDNGCCFNSDTTGYPWCYYKGKYDWFAMNAILVDFKDDTHTY